MKDKNIKSMVEIMIEQMEKEKAAGKINEKKRYPRNPYESIYNSRHYQQCPVCGSTSININIGNRISDDEVEVLLICRTCGFEERNIESIDSDD